MQLKHWIAGAALAITAGAATADGLTDMSTAERDSFRAEVRAYLLEHPEVLMEAIRVLETREAQAQAASDSTLIETNRDDLFADAASWVGGNPDGDVTLVEFIDYRCGYCRRAHNEVAELVNGDGNIRFVVKEFPILGEQSLISSRFAVAVLQVAGPDAYKTVHDTLITLRGELDDDALRKLALGLELDADAVLAQMDSPEVTQVLEDNRALAQRLKINGTPSFVVQDELLRGYLPLSQMQTLVAGKRG